MTEPIANQLNRNPKNLKTNRSTIRCPDKRCAHHIGAAERKVKNASPPVDAGASTGAAGGGRR